MTPPTAQGAPPEAKASKVNGSQSERPMPANVIQAIARVMEELPGIGRDSKSPQGYSYRGIEAITAEAQKLCGRYCVVFAPRVTERTTIDLVVGGKPWTEEQLKVEYDVYGPGGVDDKIVVGPLIGLGRDNSDKGANKSMTQAYKYALIQVFQIGDAKSDSDNDKAHEADAPPDPSTWFERNGWKDKAEHDEWRTETVASLKASTDALKASVKNWSVTNGLDLNRAIPKGLADALDAYLDKLAAPIDRTEPTTSPEAPRSDETGQQAQEQALDLGRPFA